MKSYTLFGQTITFDDGAEHVYSLQTESTQVRSETEDRLRSWYIKQDSIDKVMDGFRNFMDKVYHEQLVDRLYPEIQACGIYDMTTDMYRRRCLSDEGAKRALADVRAQYDAIEEQKNAEEQYRADRKASRGRWHGGVEREVCIISRQSNAFYTERRVVRGYSELFQQSCSADTGIPFGLLRFLL